MIRLILTTTVIFALSGCSTKIQPLPDEGPTTAQIISGSSSLQTSTEMSQSGLRRFSHITPPNSMSRLTQQRLYDLNSDFKRVPNPQIIGYVAPHFNQADMPVPGYFTVFRLYAKDSYALFTEDAAAGISEVIE